MLRAQQLTLYNYEDESVISKLDKMIPVATMLGGVIIGFLTVVGSLLDVAGSSTGIMLSISILYSYFEKISVSKKALADF